MKKNYEKFKPSKKIQKWQLIALICGGALFLAATIVFIVLFAKNIFSESTFAYCCIGLVLAFFIGGFWFYFATARKG